MTVLLPLSTFAWAECFYRHDRAHAAVQSGAMDADAAQAMIDRWAALAWLFTGEAMLCPAWQRFTTAAAQSHAGQHPVAVLAKLVAAAMAMEVDRYATAYGTDPLHRAPSPVAGMMDEGRWHRQWDAYWRIKAMERMIPTLDTAAQETGGMARLHITHRRQWQTQGAAQEERKVA